MASERRLVIAIDCDDVIVPTAAGIIENYNQRFHTQLGLQDFYRHEPDNRWGTNDMDVAMARVNEYLRSKEHAEMAPFQDSVVAINALAKKHELHLVTGRASFLEEMTKDMLNTHFADCFASIEHTNFLVTSESGLVTRSKGEVCRDLDADVLIDDHIVHGESVLEVGVEEVIVFGSYPWNQSEDLPLGMVRCHSWDETMAEIARIASKTGLSKSGR